MWAARPRITTRAALVKKGGHLLMNGLFDREVLARQRLCAVVEDLAVHVLVQVREGGDRVVQHRRLDQARFVGCEVRRTQVQVVGGAQGPGLAGAVLGHVVQVVEEDADFVAHDGVGC